MSLVQGVDGTGLVKLTTVLCVSSFPWTPVSQCGGQPSVDNGGNWRLCPSTVSPPERATNAMVGFARKCLLPGFTPHALANAHSLRTLIGYYPIQCPFNANAET